MEEHLPIMFLFDDGINEDQCQRSTQDDRQNFAAYLMPDYFPVWIAAGLPGNKKLVTAIGASTGTIPSPETTSIEYSFNSVGDIDTATRTDYNAGKPYLTRTYKFTYKQ